MAPRAMGIAITKPSAPTRPNDPQTEGGSFFFIRVNPSVVSPNYTSRIIAQGRENLQREIQ
jgi:hypothetical protein